MSTTRSIVLSSSQLYLQQAPSNKVNDYYLWFTADGFTLDAAKSYRFDIDSKTNSLNECQRYYEILLYKKETAKPAIADAHTRLMNVEEFTMDFLTHSCYFTPEESGEYYLCLHAYCEYAGRALYWDNMNLVEASMDAPDKAVMSVTPDASGILRTAIDMTMPTKSIRGNDLASLSRYPKTRRATTSVSSASTSSRSTAPCLLPRTMSPSHTAPPAPPRARFRSRCPSRPSTAPM